MALPAMVGFYSYREGFGCRNRFSPALSVGSECHLSIRAPVCIPAMGTWSPSAGAESRTARVGSCRAEKRLPCPHAFAALLVDPHPHQQASPWLRSLLLPGLPSTEDEDCRGVEGESSAGRSKPTLVLYLNLDHLGGKERLISPRASENRLCFETFMELVQLC